jgi:hypothetical protein
VAAVSVSPNTAVPEIVAAFVFVGPLVFVGVVVVVGPLVVVGPCAGGVATAEVAAEAAVDGPNEASNPRRRLPRDLHFVA